MGPGPPCQSGPALKSLTQRSRCLPGEWISRPVSSLTRRPQSGPVLPSSPRFRMATLYWCWGNNGPPFFQSNTIGFGHIISLAQSAPNMLLFSSCLIVSLGVRPSGTSSFRQRTLCADHCFNNTLGVFIGVTPLRGTSPNLRFHTSSINWHGFFEVG